MIKTYENGDEFIKENAGYLKTNEYLTAFFFKNAEYIKNADKYNYALKAYSGSGKLLALKLHPYSLLLFGDETLSEEMLSFIENSGYYVDAYLCDETIGERFKKHYKENFGVTFREALAMDFMEAKEKYDTDASAVETPSDDDTEEINELLQRFIYDCGLRDKVNKENTAKTIGNFRIIRKDGMIVSMAKVTNNTPSSEKILDVYTRNEYRGKGYARKVVAALQNEILDSGCKAVLNVDKNNPISNALYKSLGFIKLFSHGEYRRIDD